MTNDLEHKQIQEKMAEVVKDMKNIKEEVTDIKVTNAVIITKLDAVIDQNNKQDARELIRDKEQKQRDLEQDKAIESKADKEDLDKFMSRNTNIFKEVSFYIITALVSLVCYLLFGKGL